MSSNIKNLLYLMPVLLLTALLIYAMPEVVPFRDLKSIQGEIIDLVSVLLVIAVFLERSLEVFIITWRSSGAERLDIEIEFTKRDNPEELNKKMYQRVVYRSNTTRYALWTGLAAGILISTTSIRVLQPFLDPGQLSGFHLFAFHFVDVMLTGGLIAGGSDAIHKIAKIYTNFMDASAKRLEMPREGIPGGNIPYPSPAQPIPTVSNQPASENQFQST
jgi:hypothetical protein